MLLTVIFWLYLGPAFVYASRALPLEGTLGAYVTANAPFLAMAIGLLVSANGLLKTPLQAVATDRPRFDWRLAAETGGLYAAILLAFTVAGILLHPELYRSSSATIGQRLVLLPFVLLLTPLQTTCEEMLMRCLPTRTIWGDVLPAGTVRRVLTATVTAVLFAFPHLSNRELAFARNEVAAISYYLLFGFAGTYLSLVAGGFEVSIGIHAANNLFIALVCNYEHSSLPSLPLVRSFGPVGTWSEFLQLAAAMGILYLVLRRKNRIE